MDKKNTPKLKNTKEHPYLSNVDNNPFKDNRNQWFTTGLFFEFKSDAVEPMFVLKGNDRNGLKSLKNIYLSWPHVPGYEYEFAEQVLGGWEHWLAMQGSSRLKPHIDAWKEELLIKHKCKSVAAIVGMANNEEDKNRMQAAKYLAEKGWTEKSTKGRPSKLEKEAALKAEMDRNTEYDEDLHRLGLKAVK